MNLYNNGFAGGIVAIFMVPVDHSIEYRRARARGEISRKCFRKRVCVL